MLLPLKRRHPLKSDVWQKSKLSYSKNMRQVKKSNNKEEYTLKKKTRV